jgi:putative transposase
MARSPRDDYPGALRHVIVRGVERRAIFLDEEDRRRFLLRLGDALERGGGLCLAWALMPNHVHLLHQTGPNPLASVMHRLGTSYALDFNRKYGRVGHLFQDRYRAIPVHDGESLLIVLRYVHLKPVRARIVRDVDALGSHPWTGHAVLLGNLNIPFQATAVILARFDADPRVARVRLVEWMARGHGDSPHALPPGAAACDESLGDPGEDARPRRPEPSDEALADLVRRICDSFRVPHGALVAGDRGRSVARVRSVAAYVAVRRFGFSTGRVARALGVTVGAMGYCIKRGEALAPSLSLRTPEPENKVGV